SCAFVLSVSVAKGKRSNLIVRAIAESWPPTAARESRSGTATGQTSEKAAPKLEGCVSCHAKIEPMHKYGATETLDQIKGDKDAFNLTCTACHGGNPLPKKTSDDSKEIERIKHAAHVQPR